MAKADDMKAARKAMLADETDPQDEPRDIAPAAPSWKDAPPSAPVIPVREPAALPPVAPLDMTQLIQMLAAAMQQSGASTAQAIKDGLADATAMAREPIPENKISPGVSVYSHPLGDKAHARTKLRCPMMLGSYDEFGKATGVFEIFEDTCTEPERVLLNALTPGNFPVMRNDDSHAIWKVVEEKDSLGAVTRLVIAPPAVWLSKTEQAQMPSQTRFLQQLIAPASAAA